MSTTAGKKVTRKERHRAEMSAKLETTLEKLEKEAAADATGEEPRHAPRHTEGNFWKDRKDEKKRTLFMGGIPAKFHQEDIKAIVDGVEDAEGSVEKVDFLDTKVPAFKQRVVKPRNAYVLFSTVDAAMAVQSRLDGFTVENTTLRVNFSADKSQRAVAIAKREGVMAPKQDYARRAGGGRGFGGRGRGFGGGRGVQRGRGGGGGGWSR
jgi:RNA recognition motif-containing protein